MVRGAGGGGHPHGPGGHPVTVSRRIREAKEMFRTVNGEKAKRLTPKTRTAVVTILFIVVVCAAMAFIAFAGHI